MAAGSAAAISERATGRRTAVALVATLLLVVACLFAVRVTGPSNVMEDDQQRPIAYAMDAVVNGNWACQRDNGGDIMSKPPMSTWVAAVGTAALGRITHFTFFAGSGLAVLLTSLLLLGFGGRVFGRTAGFLAALVYVVSGPGVKQLCLGRTEPMFALTVAVSWICAYRAGFLGRSWCWFWAAAAFATLTKGPLGVVLAAGGLCARPWEKRTGHHVRSGRQHLIGIAAYLAITGGWFALAYSALGQDLIDRMIGRELVGHAVTGGDDAFPGQYLYKPALYFLARFLPWSPLAVLGIWRVFRRPEAVGRRRRAERFLAAQFLLGLAIFSLAPHQRADLLIPLLPAASLFAGRELARIGAARGWRLGRPRTGLVALAVVLPLVFVVSHVVGPRNPRIVNTRAVFDVAATVRSAVDERFPLTYTDKAPFALQFDLNTFVAEVPPRRAADLLAGDAAAFVATEHADRLAKLLEGRGADLHVVAATPPDVLRTLSIVGNRPKLAYSGDMATLRGPLHVRLRDARLFASAARGDESELTIAGGAPGRVEVTNQGGSAHTVRVRFLGRGDDATRAALLEPGEEVSFEVPPGAPAVAGPAGPADPGPGLRFGAFLAAMASVIALFSLWSVRQIAVSRPPRDALPRE